MTASATRAPRVGTAHRAPVPWPLALAVLAVTVAIAVAVVYLPQPLLTDLATSLGVSSSQAGLVATAVQVGYAMGIFLLVPLADRVQPRRQVPLELLLLSAALASAAMLSGLAAVATGFLAVGLVANVPQLLIAVAGRFTPADRRHTTTIVLVSALTVGIFGGRVVGGVLDAALGWRGVLLVFAAAVLLVAPAVRAVLPTHVEPVHGHTDGRMLAGTVRRLRTSRPLLEAAAQQFLAFAVFNSIWTAVVLHLTGPLFGWSVRQAALFGLVGVAAALLPLVTGRQTARWPAARVGGVAVAVLAAATASLLLDARVVWLFGLSMAAITWATLVLQFTNQHSAMAANPDGAAQANTVFMVCVFLGGSVGAVAGPVAFARGGMTDVALFALGAAVLLVAVSTAVSSSRRRAAASRSGARRP